MHQKVVSLVAVLFFSMGTALAQDIPATAPPASGVAPLPAPTAANPAPTGPVILIATSMGDITLQLDAVRAPRSVANFLRYMKERHYNGTVFYRVAAGFVIQMGSWDANVKGRPVHAPIPFEGDNGLSNLRGTVAMARGSDPTSATADFFINLADNTALDHKQGDAENKTGYAVFGQVVAGMDVVDRIAAVPVGDHGPMPGQAPVDPILVKKVSRLPDP